MNIYLLFWKIDQIGLQAQAKTSRVHLAHPNRKKPLNLICWCSAIADGPETDFGGAKTGIIMDGTMSKDEVFVLLRPLLEVRKRHNIKIPTNF